MDNRILFERLENFIEDANETNSILDKVKVIERYPDLKEIFKYTYDTINYTYGVTSENLRKLCELEGLKNVDYELFELLNLLNERKLTGHNAIRAINSFIDKYPEYDELIYSIIDRNLKTRTDIKLINRVWPGLIPEFGVSLADTYEEKMNIDFSKTPYFASRKCDGVRAIAIVDVNKVKIISRQGKVFETLDILKKDIAEGTNSYYIPFVLDGELCLVDENGNENFQEVMKQIRKKDHQIQNPMFMVFDFITLDKFFSGISDVPFYSRLEVLRKMILPKSKHMKILDQILIDSNNKLEEMVKIATSSNWEGLILRKANSSYEGKRTKNLLKVKQFIDAEYTVKNVLTGPIRHIVNGKEVTSEMLSNIIIEHKGNNVGVGSGFSMEQRLYYKDHPEELIGKVVTVRYFEETTNKDGSKSLRFPTVTFIYDGKRDI